MSAQRKHTYRNLLKKKTMIQFNKKKKQVFKKVCLCVFKLLIKYFGKELLDYIVQLLL